MSEPAPATSAADAPALDEVMLAMDVVDTLRHRELAIARELDEGSGEAALRERLRAIYRGQGIDVPDAVLDVGIRALREQRFTYSPPSVGWRRSLALAWVRRRTIGRWVGAGVLATGVLVGGYQVGVVLPRTRAAAAARVALERTLPRALAEVHAAVTAEARVEQARTGADALLAEGRTALERRDVAAAEGALERLRSLRDRLVAQYTLRIVSRPGEPSGVYRIPDDNPGARNHYLIVEAVAPDGRVLPQVITSEEDGRTATVSTWGVRVDDSTYEEVRRDKQDDGILQRRTLGEKRRGELEVTFTRPVRVGAITRW